MTLRPCIKCGEVISSGTYCSGCRPADTRPNKPSPRTRGYDSSWDKLSKRARRLQPFCTDCGSVTDLQLDHSPQAWERKAAGKPIRLGIDVQVCCGPCNRARGAARGPQTRGETPQGGLLDARLLGTEGNEVDNGCH